MLGSTEGNKRERGDGVSLNLEKLDPHNVWDGSMPVYIRSTAVSESVL